MRTSRLTEYDQALEQLYSRINYERIGHAPYTSNHYRLDRMRSLLAILGNPHSDYSIVHVAGTKGKGSTSTLIADGLRACGMRTGLVTSPHLIRLEERIQFQGQPCSAAQLVSLADAALAAAAELESQGAGRATFFELTTAMGMLHASQQEADWLVLEVGLGGRLDSTNVCRPVVSVITSISLDHQLQLGDTIAEIAAEKAGIIKPGTPVVCTARHPDARRVVMEHAARLDAPLLMLDTDFHAQWRPLEIDVRPADDGSAASMASASPPDVGATAIEAVASIRYQLAENNTTAASENRGVMEVYTRMLGSHQAENVAAALTVFQVLRSRGWQLPPERIGEAIANCIVLARLQLCSLQPPSLIDTAHNPASIAAALEALDEHFPNRPRVIVFGSSKDKDYRGMLKQLLPNCRHLVATAYQLNPRALAVDELLSAAAEIREELLADTESAADLHSAQTPSEAWHLAQQLASHQELIIATGSFFLAAELLPLVGR